MADYQIFNAGEVLLQSGVIYRDTRLAYQTYGTLDAKKANVILYPTSFGATHHDMEWLIREGNPLDPSRYFIIVPNLFGNGLSFPPSNAPSPFDRGRYPYFTMTDCVRVQQRLLREVFAIDRIALVYGFSMGGQQAFHWGALFPEMVERLCVVCGSAKTSPHNRVFIEGVRAALTTDPAWRDGWFATPPMRGLRAMARIYAGWALSQAFYREGLYRTLGFATVEEFLVGEWEAAYLRREANDLLAMLWTWQNADISANQIFHGELGRALGAIRARTLVMPCETDLYFTVEDNRREVAAMPNAHLRPIPSLWGHRAGNPEKIPDASEFIFAALREFMAS